MGDPGAFCIVATVQYKIDMVTPKANLKASEGWRPPPVFVAPPHIAHPPSALLWVGTQIVQNLAIKLISSKITNTSLNY